MTSAFLRENIALRIEGQENFSNIPSLSNSHFAVSDNQEYN